MITDKDREDAENIAGLYAPYDCDEMAAGYVSTIRAESADQARKEAAERVASAWREHGEDITLRILQESILGDSVIKENLITDHIPDIGKKLAIAVNALEEIKQIRKAGPAFESHFSKLQDIGRITNDALKEIQG